MSLPLTPEAPFSIEAFQNRHLAPGADRVDAILTMTAAGAGSVTADTGPARELLLGFIVDTSSSMQGERIDAVRYAVETAISLLDEGTLFFVVGFSHVARVIFPTDRATRANKERAAGAVHQLRAEGGTAMSQGLGAARSLFAAHPDAIAQAVFLTDGKNETERPEEAAQELRRCDGVFSCDCWGVGTDWRVGEVQDIARTLLGRASLIPDPSGIADAFRDAVGKAQSKTVKDVRLRLWTPAGAQFVFIKQVSPTIEDLTARGTAVSAQINDFPTGAWAPGESRDYHLAVDVHPGNIGDEMLAARPSVVFRDGLGVEEEIKAPGARVFATWTMDDSLSSRLDSQVAHYTGQDELASAIQEGLESRERGDEATATALLGRAVKLAHDSDNVEMTTRLKRVVDVVDPEQGTVRLKRAVNKADEMDLQLESTTTRRARRPSPAAAPAPAAPDGVDRP